ncbi:helix-hairpin-helix domain-containing protein [Geobacter sp. SVR]|uniref:ComEA family DNA-binding protein n=1 Tax=Geobacter sp. SVR TaxID=2495594 RepID=UPI0015671EE2|nr:helix-hairpin-helix domain-containing protein [Geobacter sp. SVR]BCS54242.1 competence protein ComEA [Geobacter sp. SVR]
MRGQAAGHTSYLNSEAYRRLVVVLLSLLALVPIVVRSRTSGLNPAPAAFFISSSPLVSIRGDVHHQGIYELPANPMTSTVIGLALPVSPIAACFPSGVERRAIAAGDEIRLTFRRGSKAADIAVRPIPASQRMVLGIPLDINRMEIRDFDKLPGIGPALAQRIVLYRQWNGGLMTVDDLLKVEGIGERKYSVLKKFF